MPEMHGWELTTRLVGLYPGIRQLFMSGYTADVIARHGVFDEGLQFIEKPFSARDLAQRIRQVLEGVQVPVTQSADHTQPRK